jgi:hypothetical protein
MNRKYLIFNTSELSLFDFASISNEQWYPYTSDATLRKHVTGQKTFVSWVGDDPAYVSLLSTKEGPYTYDELLQIINGPDWVETD